MVPKVYYITGAYSVLGGVMAEESVVKLQKVAGLTVGEKTYYRWQVTIPAEIVEKLGWEKGYLIAVSERNGTVSLRRRVLAPG